MGVKARRRTEGDFRNTIQVRAEKEIADGVDYFSQYGQQSLTSNDAPALSHGVSLEKPLTDTVTYSASIETNEFLTEADTPQSGSNSGRSASAQDFLSLSLGLQWNPADKAASFRNFVQTTQKENNQTSFTELEYIGNVDDSWSFLSRLRGSYTEDDFTDESWYVNHEFGVSYRPYSDDDFVFIGSVRNNLEELGLGSGSLGALNRHNYHEAAFEGYWRTSFPLEFSFRYANRLSQLGNESDWLHTDLKVLEIIAPVWRKVNVLAAGRWLTAYDAGYERYGASLGLAYELTDGLELELGYNFIGFEDENFREFRNWNDGVYFELRWAFNEHSLRRTSQLFKK